MIIQGSPHSCSHFLFLFPDGSGSARSYTRIPLVNPDLAIVALICPYRQEPEAMKCSLEALIASYVLEIRRLLPKGPYSLGGWSSGGIFAYHATVQLTTAGVQVRHLVLIDSPVPGDVDRLPQRFYDHCVSVGIFGQIEQRLEEGSAKSPQWLVPHLNATIDLLQNHHVKPLAFRYTPRTSLIWASECAFDGVKFPKLPPGSEDMKGMKFLTGARTDFTAGAWQKLLPGSEVHVDVVEGASHFSMMVSEVAKQPCLSELPLICLSLVWGRSDSAQQVHRPSYEGGRVATITKGWKGRYDLGSQPSPFED